jgi:DNA-binding MarR family transcriptional regulator
MRSSTKVVQPVKVASALPLSALLSQVLVAFTIEFDNEFELRMPHRTTIGGLADPEVRKAPWLTSLVMWANVMQYLGKEAIKAGELLRSARISKENLGMSLKGLSRWGYLTVKLAASKSEAQARKDQWIVHSTEAGRNAQKIWRPLVAEIEKRWDARFGKETVENVRTALAKLIERFDMDLPEFFPMLKYGLLAEARPYSKNNLSGLRAIEGRLPPADEHHASGRPLYALLSQVLLAFTTEFESQSDVSLAISANILRLLEESGVPLGDLPRLSGVSKEAVKMSLGILERGRYLEVADDPAARRRKLVRLTAKGLEAKQEYLRRVRIVEENWRKRFGENDIRKLRELLEQFVGDATVAASPLWRGLKPNAGGWRESVSQPDTLPHQPMVLHRGGYPDGS